MNNNQCVGASSGRRPLVRCKRQSDGASASNVDKNKAQSSSSSSMNMDKAASIQALNSSCSSEIRVGGSTTNPPDMSAWKKLGKKFMNQQGSESTDSEEYEDALSDGSESTDSDEYEARLRHGGLTQEEHYTTVMEGKPVGFFSGQFGPSDALLGKGKGNRKGKGKGQRQLERRMKEYELISKGIELGGRMGHMVGAQEGLELGERFGIDEGKQKGKKKGYGQGFAAGIEEGKMQGEKIGFKKGAQQAREEIYKQLEALGFEINKLTGPAKGSPSDCEANSDGERPPMYTKLSNLSFSLRIDTDKPSVPFSARSLNQVSAPNTIIKKCEVGCVRVIHDLRDDEEVSEEDYNMLVVNFSKIKISHCLTNKRKTFHAPNGKWFTVRQLLDKIGEFEAYARQSSEWLGGIDLHHRYLDRMEIHGNAVFLEWGS